MEKSNQWSTELFSGSCIYLLVCFFKLQIINHFFTACFLVKRVPAEHKLLLFTPLQSLTGFSLRASRQQLVEGICIKKNNNKTKRFHQRATYHDVPGWLWLLFFSPLQSSSLIFRLK